MARRDNRRAKRDETTLEKWEFLIQASQKFRLLSGGAAEKKTGVRDEECEIMNDIKLRPKMRKLQG